MAKPPPGKVYFLQSRRLASAYIFMVPLVAAYEIAVLLDPKSRSGADWLFSDLFDRVGQIGVLALNLALLGFLFLAIGTVKGKSPRIRGLYGYMALESVGWAMVLVAVGFLVPPSAFPERLSMSAWGHGVVASVGAGIYEETIFRFVLMGGMIVVLRRLMGGHLAWVVPVAIGVSAALFSLAHHRYGGEAYRPQVFFFRTMMGALLGTLYWFRGLGIVVWVHALYNVVVVTGRYV
ncbi:MAG: lysostaphin resistance A-like protein [Planctomycetota bacterium]